MSLDFGARFKMALSRAGLTQSQLAGKVSVSQPAISQWLNGSREPEAGMVANVATILGVDASWLLSGKGATPSWIQSEERLMYKQSVTWRFRAAPEDRGREYGNANIWSLPWDINTLVREAIQNSLDAALDDEIGIRVVFKVIALEGQALQDFLLALDWDSETRESSLRMHIERSAQLAQKLGVSLRDALDRLTQDKHLLVLVVEDYLTTGLIGPEDGNGNFAALTRNSLDSQKSGSISGGSYGLGKAVFWRASGLSTVLFHSRLDDATAQSSESPAGTNRFFGRVDLSWHEIDGVAFAGPGWFGKNDGSRAVSVWDNDAIAQDLHLKRLNDDPGTSIAVVGFHDPSQDILKRPSEYVSEIAEAVSHNFWPALASGRLIAEIMTFKGTDQDGHHQVDPQTHYRPFADTHSSHRREDVSAQLVEPGDVVRSAITLTIPKTRPGTLTMDPHGQLDHEAVLLVRFATPQEREHDLRNHVAYFRGQEMIIKYQSLGNLLGAPPFFAIVMCGTAAGTDPHNIAAERFLRAAEPPAHNDWTSTPELKSEYMRGGKKAIDEFMGRVGQEIRRLILTRPKDLDEGPLAIRELLRVVGDPPPPTRTPRVVIDTAKSRIDPNGRWDVYGRVDLPDDRAWRVVPRLAFAAETGAGSLARWELIPIENCTSDDGVLTIGEGSRRAKFRGISDPQSHPIPAEDSAVIVRLQRAEPIEEAEAD